MPAGQSTQLIVGASPEPDYQILKLSEGLYNNFNLKRVYYSAFVPVSDNKKLPTVNKPPLIREHRLYQADWLLRFYNFEADELLDENHSNFNIELDPKADWAINHLEKFPVEINEVSYNKLLRVPGIGPKSAGRIYKSRKRNKLGYYDLIKMGIVLKRAKYFITCKGKYFAGVPMKKEILEKRLADKSKNLNQLALFNNKEVK